MKIALFLKVANQMIDNEMAFNRFISNRVNRELKKYKFGWIGNSEMAIGFNDNDFIRNCQSVKITFDYFKTPRILRNCHKKQRNFLNRYI
jgi:hypothetical protein